MNAAPRTVAGAGRPADQGGRQLHHLPARRRQRARRLRRADQHRAARRPARHAAHRAQGGRRLHARRRGQHPGRDPAGGHHAAARAQGRPARRPVHLRARRRSTGVIREAIIAACLTAADDPALPGELAQHADHRGLDPAVDPDLGHRAELPGRDHQHHDPGRPRARGRHPGRRRHRDHREHRALPRGGQAARARPSWTARQQIAVPALVSTLCICIVFLPMFFLGGVARYLFVPLAEAVVFAMLASYVLSRTLVPTLAMYLLRPRAHRAGARRAQPAGARCSGRSSAGSSGCAPAYRGLLTRLISRQGALHPASSWPSACPPALLAAAARRELLPDHATAGSSSCTCGPRPAPASRRPPGWPTWWRRRSGARSPPASSTTSSTTSGCRTATINYMHSRSGFIGAADADILVSLKEEHRPTADHVRDAPARLPPGVSRRHLLLRARRHRDPDPQLRPARADRRADRGHRHRGQPPGRRTRS